MEKAIAMEVKWKECNGNEVLMKIEAVDPCGLSYESYQTLYWRQAVHKQL